MVEQIDSVGLNKKLAEAMQRIAELEAELQDYKADKRLLNLIDGLPGVRRLRTLIDNIPGVTFRCLAADRWTYDFVSDEIEKISGYPVADFLHNKIRSYKSIVFPEDLPLIQDKLTNALDNMQVYTIEYRIKHKNGDVRWIYEQGQGVFDNQGKIEFLDGVMLDYSERHRAIEALSKSESSLRKTQKLALIGGWELQLPANNLICSTEICDLYGINVKDKPTSWLGYLDLIHPDDRQLFKKTYSDSINVDEFEVEHRVIHKLTGEIHYIYEKINHIRDSNNNIIESTGIAYDITEKKKLEQTKNSSEEYFQKVIDTSPVPYALNDNKGNIVYLNRAFINVFGYELSEIPTLEIWRCAAYPNEQYRNSTISRWRERLNSSKLNNTVFEPLEIVIRCKNGKDKTVLASMAALSGRYENIHLVVLYDISERKQIEEKLHKTVNLLENIVNSTPDLIFVKDKELKSIFCNEAYARGVGKSREEMYGNTDIENGWDENLVKGNPDKGIKGFVHDDLNALSGVDVHNPNDLANIEGEIHIFDTHKIPLRDEENNIIGVLGVARDVTESKKIEQQLRQSQKMEAIGKLTGGIAHDFNNLLGVILGYNELLQEALSDDPKTIKYISQIEVAGNRARSLTSKLLSFSRKNYSDAVPCVINSVLLREQPMLEKALTAKISLILDLQNELWTTYLDQERLADSLLNMSINAMHAMPSGGKLIIQTENICSKELDLPNIGQKDCIKLTIIDTGAGIESDVIEHVFEPFFTTKGSAGSGLGMSQVYGFVMQSKGDIFISSEVGSGTKISIYFPRYQSAINTEKIDSYSSGDVNNRGTETILLVDDELALKDFTEETLLLNGYKVLTAENAHSALELLAVEKIDLLLSDVIMPDMDGHQLAKIVREKYPDIKIQMMSGYNDTHYTNEADEDLKKNQLNKPFTVSALLSKVRSILDN